MKFLQDNLLYQQVNMIIVNDDQMGDNVKDASPFDHVIKFDVRCHTNNDEGKSGRYLIPDKCDDDGLRSDLDKPSGSIYMNKILNLHVFSNKSLCG